METEYSKRVYQGVRVKHTVKDLLAEKRSRQTSGSRYNGGMSPPQSAFVQMPGTHMLPGYYGMRRPFISDVEFSHPGKSFPAEAYAATLGSKSLSCDPSSVTGYPSYMDGYYAEALGDYRSAPFSTGGSSLFPPSALPSLLPPFSGETSHYFLKDSWEQNTTDTGNQTEVLCSDGLAAAAAPPLPPLFSTESGSPTHYRASARSSALSGTQPYTLHSLDDAHYPTPYSTTGYMPCTSYMAVTGDLTPKMAPLSAEDSEGAPVPSDTLNWAKDDGSSSWPPYEIRRVY
ncbi:POU class 2 homeobox associating-factor 2-like [Anguilla rostrata]|uniref:POU class 2 homeobox associating-factor 2-like n=1 Tax=Anguilla rostrata TaxID=7938 RepID=UPI0030CD5C35